MAKLTSKPLLKVYFVLPPHLYGARNSRSETTLHTCKRPPVEANDRTPPRQEVPSRGRLTKLKPKPRPRPGRQAPQPALQARTASGRPGPAGAGGNAPSLSPAPRGARCRGRWGRSVNYRRPHRTTCPRHRSPGEARRGPLPAGPPAEETPGGLRPAPLPGIPRARSAGLGSARLGWAPRLAPWPPTASTSPCATPPSPGPPPPPAPSSACSTSGGRQPSTGERGSGRGRRAAGPGPGARPGVRGAGGAPGASGGAGAGRPRRARAVEALVGSRPDGGSARLPAVTGRCCPQPSPGEGAQAASPSRLPSGAVGAAFVSIRPPPPC